MSNVTNEEYIELINHVLTELRPDQPVTVHVRKVTDPRSKRVSEKLSIKLDVLRGPETEVLFDKKDVLSLGELPLRAFITSKLCGLGVHPVEVRQRAAHVTDAPEKPVVATDAEAAKLREMLAKRKPAVPVEDSLIVADIDEVLEAFGGDA
jgi:hypothetical protein